MHHASPLSTALLLCISRPVTIASGSVSVDQRAERFAYAAAHALNVCASQLGAGRYRSRFRICRPTLSALTVAREP
jgi:hypothetical protein